MQTRGHLFVIMFAHVIVVESAQEPSTCYPQSVSLRFLLRRRSHPFVTQCRLGSERSNEKMAPEGQEVQHPVKPGAIYLLCFLFV